MSNPPPWQFPVADRFAAALKKAGLPPHVFTAMHIDHAVAKSAVLLNPAVKYVHFTGSVAGGRAVQAVLATGGRFIPLGLELGGCDSAYVRHDANVKAAAEGLFGDFVYLTFEQV